jgi:phytoene desaturase
VIPYVELGLGGYYIQGGLYCLVEALIEIAERVQVRIHGETEVERILHDNHRVKGVRIHGENVEGDVVLCNGDVVTSYHNLIPGFPKTKKKLSRLEPSLSGLIFFWGIQGQHPRLKQHNIFFSKDYEKEFKQIFGDLSVPDDPTLYVSVSSKTDPEHAPEGCENWFVLINVPYLTEGQQWDSSKIDPIRATVLRKLKRYGFDINGKIRFERTLTPTDIANRFYSNRGSIYGISSNTLNSAFQRPPNRSRQLHGLYFTGGSTHPGGGVPMCLLSGKIAAELIDDYFYH